MQRGTHMMPLSWIYALSGGALIGTGAALLFLTHGRIAGISGVLGSLLPPLPKGGDRSWRISFLLGILLAGMVAARVTPWAIGASVRTPAVVIVAGLLVGYGTRWGSGCTSGHGVCGLSRWSARSMVAVATFMLTGSLTAWIAGGLS
jgi:uncharacterized protein